MTVLLPTLRIQDGYGPWSWPGSCGIGSGAAAAGGAFDQVAGQARAELGDLGGDLALAGAGLVVAGHCSLLSRRQGPPTHALKVLFQVWRLPSGGGPGRQACSFSGCSCPTVGAESWTVLG